MIMVNQFIINEELIKYAVPIMMMPKPDHEVAFCPPSTKIVFTDGTEKTFETLEIGMLFNEISKKGMNNNGNKNY